MAGGTAFLAAMTRAPVRYRIAMLAYQAALALAEPLVWRYFSRRGVKDPAYLEHWAERRGQGVGFAADVWVHAVSLGEFRSAEPLIAELLRGGKKVIVTHATPAGRRASEAALSQEIAGGLVHVAYAPIDRQTYWKAFFSRHAPRNGLVMEMEFWPGMIEAARAAGVPLWLANSQIPGRTYPRARRVRKLLGCHPVARAKGVFAKSQRMAERFKALGADDVRVVGETRFDIPPPEQHVAAGNAFAASLGDRPVVTFASVVQGEEDVYHAASDALLSSDTKPLVIWVPRAPEAFDETYDRLASAGLRVARRSAVFDEQLQPTDGLDCDVLLGDSFGEMFFYLAAADAVSVGGGFVEKGAHNIIEPLALAKPVVTGPHIWTIEFPGEEARAAGVLTVCKHADKLGDTLLNVIGGDGMAEVAFHQSFVGASERIARILMKEDVS